MQITVGAKDWSGGKQCGLRLYVTAIRLLGNEITVPDKEASPSYNSLREFLDTIANSQGDTNTPEAFSRDVFIVKEGEIALVANVNFSDNTDRTKQGDANPKKPSTQAYITADKGSWFETWVKQHIDTNFVVSYYSGPSLDVLVLP